MNSPYCARREKPGRRVDGDAIVALARRSGGQQHAAEDFLLERTAGADRDAGQRIVRDRDRQARLVPQHLVEALQKRAAAGQDDAWSTMSAASSGAVFSSAMRTPST